MNKKPLKKGTSLRPLLIASAVGAICQTAYAQTVVELSATPFASRPLHLEESATNSGIPGVRPNFVFFVDNSTSMNAVVPGSGNQTRIQVVRNALTSVVNNYGDRIRWNLYTLNNSTVYPFMTAATIRPRINAITLAGGTPTTWRYSNAVRVLESGIQYRCQKNYVVVLSDGDANRGAAATAGLPAFQPWETTLYGTFTNPRDNRGQPGTWDIFWRHRGQYTAPGGGAYFTYINGLNNGISYFSHRLAAADLRTNTANGVDLEGGYWDYNDTDPNPVMRNTLFAKQSIETFVVGFAQGLSTVGRGYLVDAASCENSTNEANKLGRCWFPVTTAQDLTSAFDAIFQQVSSANQAILPSNTYSASTPSATGSTIAELAATLTLDTGKWSSRLRFAKFVNGALDNTVEDAGYSGRRVLVNNGLGLTNSLYWLDSYTPAARKTDFGIIGNQEFTNAFVPWLTRSSSVTDAQIETAAATAAVAAGGQRTVSKYRERAPGATDPERQMADVIGAPVVAMGKISDTDSKQKYVVTAANDGMVYIFSATGATPQYNLALNYLPAGMQRESALPPSDPNSITVGKTIRVTADANYGTNDTSNPHVYLNNGGISWVRTPKTGGRNQQDILLGTMGQGGRGAYALTIAGKKRSSTTPSTPAGLDATPASWGVEVPLWETEKSAGNALGYTISTGLVGQIATETAANGFPNVLEGVHLYAFVPNGYATGVSSVPYDTSPTLYVYDMMGQEFGHDTTMTSASVANGNQPGQLITKLSTGNTTGALSSPALLDSNKDGMVDFAYAGDTNGDLYRFDLRGAPSTWATKISKIYDGATDQPITAAPVLYRIDDNNFVVIFGTGSDVYSVDRTTINRQIVMGIHDDLTNTNPTTLQPGDRNIIDQSITLGTDGYRYLSTNTFTTGTSRAWRILLDPGVQVSVDNVTSSERVVSKPQLLTRTVFFTTRIYEFQKTSTSLPSGADPANTCYSTSANVSTGGTSWQMAVDAETGSGPMAGESADKTLGSYFEFSDALAPTVGAGQSRPVLAGVNLGYLSSAPALVNTSASSGEHLQTNAHGELGYSGEIVSAFDRSPNQLTGTNNPLDTLNPTCISKNEAYSLLIARGGTNAGEQHNLTELKLISPICPDPLNQGKTLIRVDWRQVPL